MPRMKHLKNPEQIPLSMEKIFENIAQCIDDFCTKHLNEEYASLLRKLAANLCRKRPSPLLHGNLQTWIAGMVHAIGMVNFLFDRSQTPYLSSSDLCASFGLAQSTVSNKSKQIRDLLKISQFDLNWTLPSKIEDRPLAWMISINGFIADVRYLPLEIQEEAFRKGLIPYVPSKQHN
jgi:Domain of unknown function (DUF6398)